MTRVRGSRPRSCRDPMSTAPASGNASPPTIFNSVVLPLPFSPSSAAISPCATENDTSRRTSTAGAVRLSKRRRGGHVFAIPCTTIRGAPRDSSLIASAIRRTNRVRLAPQAEVGDQLAVALEIFVLEVHQQAPALADLHEQTAAAVMVLL